MKFHSFLFTNKTKVCAHKIYEMAMQFHGIQHPADSVKHNTILNEIDKVC